MDENPEENEVIKVIIVDSDDEEKDVAFDVNKFIKLEITNTEDENFGLNLEETDNYETENQETSEDALLLKNIKIEVIDPETEFGELYANIPEEDDDVELLETEEINQHRIAKRKRRRPRLKRRIDKDSVHLLNEGLKRGKTLHTCGICGYTSHQKSHYRRHLTIHFKPDGIFCGICRERMSSRDELNEHMEEHKCPENEGRFKCNRCAYTSNKLTNVAQHTEIHYKPRRDSYDCQFCNFTTYNKNRFKSHVALHEDESAEKLFKCPVCLLSFGSVTLRRRHIQRYKSPDDPTKYQCPDCSYLTRRFNNFKQHMLIHRNEYEVDMFLCPFCPFKSKRKTDLKQHIIIKHKSDDEVSTYVCDFCSYQTRRGSHLTSHMKNMHKDELVLKKCGLCSYKTISRVLIEKHFAIHSKLPNRFFLCSLCGYGCKDSRTLAEHVNDNHVQKETGCRMTEDGEKKVVIENKVPKESEDCGYSLELVKVKKEVVDYEDSQDENYDDMEETSMFFCQFSKCSFMTEVERDMKIHLTISHNKKGDDNQCPECTFHTTFRHIYLDHLKVHMINIEHLKPHLCDVCGTRWIRPGDLTRHMSVHWSQGSFSNNSNKKRVQSDNNNEYELPKKKLLKCKFCSYQSRVRYCLFKHMLMHGKDLQLNFNDYVEDVVNDDFSDE